MNKLSDKNIIFNNSDIEKKLNRISLEIIENNLNESKITLFGISDNGIKIAQKIIKYLVNNSKIDADYIKVTLDKKNPVNTIEFDKKFNIKKSSIIVIDDVSQSGKILLSVVSKLMNYNPSKIQTSVLINRDQTSFPIKVDFSGISLSTSTNNHIDVEIDNKEEIKVYLS
ncbi:MAG: phosphoribosyltransferase family protein [Bacteroidota bacterium]